MLSGNHSPSFTKIKTPFCSWIFQFSHLPRGSELQAIEVLGPDQRKLLSAFFLSGLREGFALPIGLHPCAAKY
jgi:hypothetical protein